MSRRNLSENLFRLGSGYGTGYRGFLLFGTGSGQKLPGSATLLITSPYLHLAFPLSFLFKSLLIDLLEP
jgi:hypothetical protein